MIHKNNAHSHIPACFCLPSSILLSLKHPYFAHTFSMQILVSILFLFCFFTKIPLFNISVYSYPCFFFFSFLPFIFVSLFLFSSTQFHCIYTLSGNRHNKRIFNKPGIAIQSLKIPRILLPRTSPSPNPINSYKRAHF